MTKAEIYRRAAELVQDDKERYSCNAVVMAGQEFKILTWDQRYEYADMFASIGWGSYWHLAAETAEQEWGKDGRVLALCFAAAMADAGDL